MTSLQANNTRSFRIDFTEPSLFAQVVRKGVFREAAREIVRKDRACKSTGLSQDTGGSIARAMEQAYKLGLTHGQKGSGAGEPHQNEPYRLPPWSSLPSRPRNALESIARNDWIVVMQPNPNPAALDGEIWACYTALPGVNQRFEFARTYSLSTLAPLVALGLMHEVDDAQDTFLRITDRGRDTLDFAVHEGHIRPKAA